jgi:hypothetical protein
VTHIAQFLAGFRTTLAATAHHHNGRAADNFPTALPDLPERDKPRPGDAFLRMLYWLADIDELAVARKQGLEFGGADACLFCIHDGDFFLDFLSDEITLSLFNDIANK